MIINKKLNSTQEALTEARVTTAEVQKDIDMQAERLVNAAEKVTKLDQERAELMAKLAERESHIAALSRVQVDSQI